MCVCLLVVQTHLQGKGSNHVSFTTTDTGSINIVLSAVIQLFGSFKCVSHGWWEYLIKVLIHFIFCECELWSRLYCRCSLECVYCTFSDLCTEWPKGLETDAQCQKHFPVEVESSDYVFSGPSIRDPRARTVTVRVSSLAFFNIQKQTSYISC